MMIKFLELPSAAPVNFSFATKMADAFTLDRVKLEQYDRIYRLSALCVIISFV